MLTILWTTPPPCGKAAAVLLPSNSGHYDGDELRYAGKVGTGYDRRTLELLHQRLAPLRRATSPFSAGPVPARDVQWVTPKLVGEIGFSEWTTAGLLRHPRFGLREDKPESEVHREE